MADLGKSESSGEACPVCGEHRLQLLYYPTVDVTGVRQYDDMLGFGDAHPVQAPGIGCEACGAAWPDLAAFREAQNAARP